MALAKKNAHSLELVANEHPQCQGTSHYLQDDLFFVVPDW